MTKSGIIIQARTGSARLPNKMLLPFYENKGIFEIILQRLKESPINIPVIIATTPNESDKRLIEIGNKYGYNYYIGSEENVLRRFIDAATYYRLDNIVRICADNPFLDLNALDNKIAQINDSFDYWCYAKHNYTPTIKTGFGFWTEVVTLKALKKVAISTSEAIFNEHVTNYIYSHPKDFNIHFERINKEIEENADLRLTVDTKADFDLLKEIYATIVSNKINFSALEISNLVKENPQWLNIMRHETLKNVK